MFCCKLYVTACGERALQVRLGLGLGLVDPFSWWKNKGERVAFV